MSSSGFCNYLSSSLGSTLSSLGQVSSRLASQIDSSALQNVAQNIEQAVRENIASSTTSTGVDAASSAPSQPRSTAAQLPRSQRSSRASSISSSTAGDNIEGHPMGSGAITANRSQNTEEKRSMMTSCCDSCGFKFNLIYRKKQCNDCHNVFCSTCCPKPPPDNARRKRLCNRCIVLNTKPPVRADLMRLRVKDLQQYLVSRRINTKSCVEKKDLVELVMRQNGGTDGAASTSSTRIRNPVERKQSFPQSYVESTHRHDWLSKLDDDGEGEERDQEQEADEEASAPAEENMVQSPTSDDLVQEFVMVSSPSEGQDQEDIGSEDTGEDEVRQFSPPPSEESAMGIDTNDDDKSNEAKGISIPKNPRVTDPSLMEGASATSCSPSKKFANKGLVYLSEIETIDELNELSVKQMKDILAVNRVNFKGVMEKDELYKILERLWKAEKKLMEAKDNLEDSDLCKIFLDDPVDCVMLECGHMCTCLKCGKQMNECPICRQYVVRVVKIFKS